MAEPAKPMDYAPPPQPGAPPPPLPPPAQPQNKQTAQTQTMKQHIMPNMVQANPADIPRSGAPEAPRTPRPVGTVARELRHAATTLPPLEEWPGADGAPVAREPGDQKVRQD